jgi:hypothetical protein
MAEWIEGFNTFIDRTPPSYLTNPGAFHNDVIRRSTLFRKLFPGKAREEMFLAGPEIRDSIFLEGVSTFRAYRSGKPTSWSNPQTHDDWHTRWASYLDEISWIEDEYQFNRVADLTPEARTRVFKLVRNAKYQRFHTSVVEGFDDALIAVPDYGTMEEPGPSVDRVMNSIFMLVNEFSEEWDTQFETRVEGIDPSAKGNWKPGQYDYDASDFTNTQDGLLASMDDLFTEQGYEQMPRVPGIDNEGSQDLKVGDWADGERFCILTGRTGRKLYRAALHAAGESLQISSVGSQDGSLGSGIAHSGVMIMSHPRLDDIAIIGNPARTRDVAWGNTYGGGTAMDKVTLNSIGASTRYPFYWFIDTRTMHTVVHEQFADVRSTREPDGQVGFWVKPVRFRSQLICRSRRQQAILRPEENNTV